MNNQMLKEPDPVTSGWAAVLPGAAVQPRCSGLPLRLFRRPPFLFTPSDGMRLDANSASWNHDKQARSQPVQ